MKRNRDGFTLVELLVVIGIIGLLLSILLPALSGARQQSFLIACQSNLHNIGLGISQYTDDYHGFYPPSNYYKGLSTDPVSGQVPSQPSYGYVHWSSFIFGHKDEVAVSGKLATSDSYFATTKGWEIFQCPALGSGGAPPANTYSGNSDGLPNEDGLTDSAIGVVQSVIPNGGGPVTLIDYQAPRLAYAVNEAICPRGIFQTFFGGKTNQRFYKFVQASRIHNSSNVVLASEISGDQTLVTTTSQIDGVTLVSSSRRPLNGISVRLTGTPVQTIDQAYYLPFTKNFVWANLTDLNNDPEKNYTLGSTIGNSLDTVGRNHGTRKLGPVAGDTQGRLWDLRQSNFLYVDGHVEAHKVSETVYPVNQWGPDFYTLDK